MKVISTKIDEQGKAWFNLELDRNTDILAKELFTEDDINNAKQQGLRDFLSKLVENNS